jgi:soluble lytic murein transglycosylase
MCIAFLVSLETGFIFQQVFNNNDVIFVKRQSVHHIQKVKTKTIPNETNQIVKAIETLCPDLEKKQTLRLANIIQKESKKYGYDWKLVVAIMKTESNFDKHATSSKGAIGLMQLMPNTAEWLSPKLKLEYQGIGSLYEPERNIRLGIHYLSMMHRKFGDMDKALVAYNKGPKKLTQDLNLGEDANSEFLDKVMGYYANLKNSYPA